MNEKATILQRGSFHFLLDWNWVVMSERIKPSLWFVIMKWPQWRYEVHSCCYVPPLTHYKPFYGSVSLVKLLICSIQPYWAFFMFRSIMFLVRCCLWCLMSTLLIMKSLLVHNFIVKVIYSICCKILIVKLPLTVYISYSIFLVFFLFHCFAFLFEFCFV